jgi:hypothetical protein
MPSNRVHDIEFATEIATSLLSQVRHLQALVQELRAENKALKAVDIEKSRLEIEVEGPTQRLRALDESEQSYKDEVEAAGRIDMSATPRPPYLQPTDQFDAAGGLPHTLATVPSASITTQGWSMSETASTLSGDGGSIFSLSDSISSKSSLHDVLGPTEEFVALLIDHMELPILYQSLCQIFEFSTSNLSFTVC